MGSFGGDADSERAASRSPVRHMALRRERLAVEFGYSNAAIAPRRICDDLVPLAAEHERSASANLRPEHAPTRRSSEAEFGRPRRTPPRCQTPHRQENLA
jgi:hypothetical protein